MRTVVTTETYDDNNQLVKRETTTTTFKRPMRVHLLIDNSSSMGGWQQKVVSGVNEFVQMQQRAAQERGANVSVSVSFFSSLPAKPILEIKREKVDVHRFRFLEASEIVPYGNTPLFDAVYDTVRNLELTEKDSDVSLVILTDGEENSSRIATSHSIKNMLHEKQVLGWLVTYLGANQDAWAVGSSFGTQRATTATFNMASIDTAIRASGASTSRYMGARAMGMSNSDSASAATFTADEIAGMQEKDKT